MTITDLGYGPIINAEVSGEVNGKPLTGAGTAQYMPTENEITAQMTFEPRFEMVAAISSSSIISLVCSAFSRGLFGAVNLSSLFEDGMSGTVDFRVQNLGGRERADQHVVALITQDFTLERVSATEYRFRTTLHGWYDRAPKFGISKSPGYSMHLRQVRPGVIEGVYGQVIPDTEGNAQYLFSRREYRYKGTSTLPHDEVMVYRIVDFSERLDVHAGSHIVDFRSHAYYVPISDDLLPR
jgi:hypothetical protein